MKKHKWHKIAPEAGYDEDPIIWEWCSQCGAMQLGCEVFYIGGKKLTSTVDMGCPDVYISLVGSDYMVNDNIKEIEKEVLAKKSEQDKPITPSVYIDPFELPTEVK